MADRGGEKKRRRIRKKIDATFRPSKDDLKNDDEEDEEMESEEAEVEEEIPERLKRSSTSSSSSTPSSSTTSSKKRTLNSPKEKHVNFNSFSSSTTYSSGSSSSSSSNVKSKRRKQDEELPTTSSSSSTTPCAASSSSTEQPSLLFSPSSSSSSTKEQAEVMISEDRRTKEKEEEEEEEVNETRLASYSSSSSTSGSIIGSFLSRAVKAVKNFYYSSPNSPPNSPLPFIPLPPTTTTMATIPSLSPLCCEPTLTLRLLNSTSGSAESTIEAAADHQIDCADMELLEPLSSGNFGDVFKGTWKGKDVAVKILKQSNGPGEFQQEVLMLSKMNHPNIVQFYGACSEPYFLIVLEFIPRGSLHSVLYSEKFSFAKNIPLLLSLARDILQGLHFLHSTKPPIIHRDLKPANILITNDNRAKITDFGISREKAMGNASMTGFLGTPSYMAPELMNGKRYDTSVDIYSFGIVLWEMLAGAQPFAGLQPISVALQVQRGHRPPFAETTPKSLCSVIESCWTGRFTKRPKTRELLTLLDDEKHFH